MSLNPNKRRHASDEGNLYPSKKQKMALYLDDNTPIRTIQVTNIGDNICVEYLRGYFEHAAGAVSNVNIVYRDLRDDQWICDVAYVTFVLPDDAARLLCDPDLQLGLKFTIKEADRVYQPKVDSNAVKFIEINDNCLLKIASHLDLIDIVNLSKTSVRMWSFSQLILERRTHFSFDGKIGDQSLKQQDLQTILPVMGSYIRKIYWRGLNETHLQYLSRFCPNVTELRLVYPSRSLTWTAINDNKTFFKNIKKLVIVRAALFDATMKAITSSKQLRLIECRNIRGNFFSTWKSCRLMHLKICNFNFERMIQISEIGRITTLKSLSVNRIEISSDTIYTLGLYKNLQHLKLENVNDTLKSKLYSALPVRLPKLTKLNIKMERKAGKINSKSVSTMISSFAKLTYFAHSPMSWKLLEMVRQVRTLQKQAQIEIGIQSSEKGGLCCCL